MLMLHFQRLVVGSLAHRAGTIQVNSIIELNSFPLVERSLLWVDGLLLRLVILRRWLVGPTA